MQWGSSMCMWKIQINQNNVSLSGGYLAMENTAPVLMPVAFIFSRIDFPRSNSRYPVHAGRMDAMKMDRVGVTAGIDKTESNPVPLHTS